MYAKNFTTEIELRKSKIQSVICRSGADAFLVSDNANLFYTSGRVFSGYTYIPAEGEMIYFVRRPVGLSRENVVYIRKPEQIPDELSRLGIALPRVLLLENDSLTYNESIRLRNIFSEAKIENGTPLIRGVRTIKTPYEIGLIRESAAHHSSMYRKAPSVYKQGMSDVEYSIELERLARLHGSLGLVRIFGKSMEIYMGSVRAGENADEPSPYDFALGGAGLDPSLPISSNGSIMKPGNTIMVDIGGNFTGYMSDMSRVFSLGEIPEKAREAHDVSLEIQSEIEKMAKPGVAASEIYDLAFDIAKKAGFEANFMGHRQKAGFIGHGVGIELNEAPVFAPRSKDILAEGMVFALEPKFVIPQVGAVGIENTFVVTASGIEKLTQCEEGILPLD